MPGGPPQREATSPTSTQSDYEPGPAPLVERNNTLLVNVEESGLFAEIFNSITLATEPRAIICTANATASASSVQVEVQVQQIQRDPVHRAYVQIALLLLIVH
ncbi:Calmodulin-binding protein 60 G [Frankliniella fusca]|uniref:Calmodulin-binding protein 60 G n=1 Tax=Frankliniella fusca TaxID=407009 RepID=A0AAE1LA55_9NEOP|nr:Calmodulin-binding protein 60 G [Frankliniella fusca]